VRGVLRRDDSMSQGDLGIITEMPDDGNPADVIVPSPGMPRAVRKPRVSQQQHTWFDKLEAFISKLSTRDNFWNSVCSLIWLPLAFFSGIRTKQIGEDRYQAYLPFRKFNKNWYNAMAGGALLGNAEIAGGMYVFGICGSDYTVVCKNLNYTFLRPCLGPAVYQMHSRENLREKIATGAEFNCTLDMDIMQQPIGKKDRERSVGRCEVTFHVTPKVHHKVKALRKRK